MNPAVSVVIRTFNSARTLPMVLERLRPLPRDEIIIVDSGSTDPTLAIAKEHTTRIILAPKPFNYSKSLNLGFQAAQNPWVLVLSSHCIPQNDLIGIFRTVAMKFPDTVAVAYGECSLVENKISFQRNILFADRTTSRKQQQQVFGGNSLAFYRRAFWLKLPFDEQLPTAEDLAWALKVLKGGASMARVPQASALYRNQGSLRHMFYKGWWESRLAIKLAEASGMTFFQLAINFASFLKKLGAMKITPSVFLRQCAHALGAYLSPKFR